MHLALHQVCYDSRESKHTMSLAAVCHDQYTQPSSQFELHTFQRIEGRFALIVDGHDGVDVVIGSSPVAVAE